MANSSVALRTGRRMVSVGDSVSCVTPQSRPTPHSLLPCFCLFVCFVASQHTLNLGYSSTLLLQKTHSVQAVALSIHKGYLWNG